MKNKKKIILQFLPFAFTLAFCILAVSLHHIACPTVIPSVYIQAPAYALVPLIFPALEKWAHIKVPGFLIAVITIQIIISVDLGTALNFYAFIPHYDKFLHTYFGVWGAQIVYYFIYVLGGGRMKEWGKLLFTMLGVLGIAAVWEVSEYAMSLIFGTDPQLWKVVLNNPSYHPLADTMWDIIVAAIGVVIFYVTLFIDVKSGGRLYRGTLTPRPLSKRVDEAEGIAEAQDGAGR